jgi:tRNA threonylcarbamoyladenosine biosynthesis protein TsaB
MGRIYIDFWTKMALFGSKTLVLSVETSGRRGSVAFGAGERVIAEITFSGVMRHSAELFTSVQALLNQVGKEAEDIEQLYITVGPGSFTGLRIGVTMAKMMSFANDIGILGVSTMDVIAHNASRYIADTKSPIKQIGTILDAKRSQFYISIFERVEDDWVKVQRECLMTASEFTERFGGSNKPLLLLGEGLLHYADQFRTEGINIIDEDYWYPSASSLYFIGRTLAQTGNFADAAALNPFYLREPEAVEKRQRGRL